MTRPADNRRALEDYVEPPVVDLRSWTPVLVAGGARPSAEEPKDAAPRVRWAPPPRRRLRGLDGLRAVAVLSVVAFHLDFAIAPGGFLGVDVFFVISGFLITNLLVGEIRSTGRLRLGAFYLRRARRLLPTVLVLLLVVSVAAATAWDDQLASLRGGVLSSLGYVTNWWLIARNEPYFVATGRPSMLEHLWSLAIEEQYYIVWSVVVLAIAGLLSAGRRQRSVNQRRLGAIVAVAAVLAAASAVIMDVLAERADLPYAGSTTRVYFGSDTHTTGLFLGSAAGAWLALYGRTAAGPGRQRPRQLVRTDLLGLVAVGVLIWQVRTITEFSPQLYRGGFLFFDVVVLVAILCATRHHSVLGRVLDMRPVQWIGRRSYAIYIWHWPVVVVTRPGLDVAGPTWLVNAARLLLILGLAALSYHFVEVPLRSGELVRWRRERRNRATRRREIVAAALTVCAAGGLVLAAQSTSAPGPPAPVRRSASVAPPPVLAAPHAPRPHRPASGRHQPGPVAGKPSISAFGDSVLLGAGPVLRRHASAFYLDAIEGRQAYLVLDDVLRDARQHRLQPYVVVHIGNNGIISPAQLGQAFAALSAQRRVVVLTDRVARDWQDPNNHTVHNVAAHYANVRVLDWFAASAGHRKWLADDGLHLTRPGARAYVRMVVRALTSR
jgi:peptidoglycan/LPS O-acetylase OafA/YrhL